jgi:hypothetical protein
VSIFSIVITMAIAVIQTMFIKPTPNISNIIAQQHPRQ